MVLTLILSNLDSKRRVTTGKYREVNLLVREYYRKDESILGRIHREAERVEAGRRMREREWITQKARRGK